MRPGRRPPDESGAAVVEYVLVSTFLILLFLGVVQVSLVLHARNVLVADAAEGARAAAVRGAVGSDGEAACAALIRQSLSGAVQTGAKPCDASELAAAGGHPPLVRMDAAVTLPMTFIPLGRVHLHVAARAIKEPE